LQRTGLIRATHSTQPQAHSHQTALSATDSFPASHPISSQLHPSPPTTASHDRGFTGSHGSLLFMLLLPESFPLLQAQGSPQAAGKSLLHCGPPTCLTMVFSMGYSRISALAPGAPPSLLALKHHHHRWAQL